MCTCVGMYACMCTYVFVYVYLYMPTDLRRCVRVRPFAYVHVCTSSFYVRPLVHITWSICLLPVASSDTRTYVHTYVRTYIDVCVKTLLCTSIRACVHMRGRVRTYARSHTGSCVCTCIPMRIRTTHVRSYAGARFRAYVHTHVHMRVYVHTDT